MNILYVNNDMSVSGSPKAILTELKLLKGKGHNVYVVSRGGPLVTELQSLGISHFELELPIMGYSIISKTNKLPWREKLHHIKQHVKNGRIFKSIFRLNKIVINNDIHIIQAHQPGPALVSYYVAKKHKLPYILRVQHIVKNEFPTLFYEKVVRYAFKVSVITPEIKQHLVDIYNVDSKDIAVIPTAVEMKANSSNQESVFNRGNFHILSVTTLGSAKYRAVIELIKAVTLLMEDGISCVLKIVGDGPHRVDIEKLISSLDAKHRKNIILLGQQHSVEKYFKETDVVVGVGRVAMESLYFGKPLLCCSHFSYGGIFDESNAEEVSYYNFSGRNFLEKSLDERQIYNDLKKLSKSSVEEIEKMSIFNKKYFNQHYSVEKICTETEALFLKAIKRKNSRVI